MAKNKKPQDHKKKSKKGKANLRSIGPVGTDEHMKDKYEGPTMATGPVSSVQEWKATSKVDEEMGELPLEVPSGNVALVRPVGMQAFLSEGLIPNSLLGIVTAAMEAGQKGEEVDQDALVDEMMADIVKNPEQIAEMVSMADACTVYCVIKPEVLAVPEKGEPRLPDKLYVDQVDLDDKLFILNFAVGGSRKLEPFRKAIADGVAAVSSLEGVE